MARGDSAIERHHDDPPFSYKKIRQALGRRVESKTYFKKAAVHETNWRTYHFLGFVGEAAHLRARENGYKTVKVKDVIDAYQMDIKKLYLQGVL